MVMAVLLRMITSLVSPGGEEIAAAGAVPILRIEDRNPAFRAAI
jgi:hypothetical protein